MKKPLKDIINQIKELGYVTPLGLPLVDDQVFAELEEMAKEGDEALRAQIGILGSMANVIAEEAIDHMMVLIRTKDGGYATASTAVDDPVIEFGMLENARLQTRTKVIESIQYHKRKRLEEAQEAAESEMSNGEGSGKDNE